MRQMAVTKDHQGPSHNGRSAAESRRRAGHPLIGMHDAMGNRGMQRLAAMQASPVGVATLVPRGAIQRTCACGSGGGEGCSCDAGVALPWVQRKAHDAGAAPARSLAATALSGQGSGHPLDAASRAFMETRFGRDLGGVRIHTDAAAARSARMLNAHAFTVGNDVYFAQGRYDPATPSGRTLLAHELTHTIQQGGGTGGSVALRSATISHPQDASEREAEHTSERISADTAVGAVVSGDHSFEASHLRQSPADEPGHRLDHIAVDTGHALIQRQVAQGAGSGGFDPKCLEILSRILSFLYGGANHDIGTVGVMGPDIKRGVIERYTQLLEDTRDLYINNRTLAQADPVYGSWEGHQLALEGELRGLRRALDEWRASCSGPGGSGSPQEADAVVRTANVWATRPVPDRPRKATPQGGSEPLYTLTLQHAGGTNLTRDAAAAAINEELRWATNRFDGMSGEHELLKQNREEHNVTGWLADVIGGASMPPLSIWDDARAKLAATRAATAAKDINAAMLSFTAFEQAFATARKQYLAYKDATIGGAETAVIGLEVIAVAAAVVFVVAGIAAVASAASVAAATAGTTAATTAPPVTVIAATDAAAASQALRTALAASQQLTVPTELLTMAGEAAPWIEEDAQFMSIVK